MTDRKIVFFITFLHKQMLPYHVLYSPGNTLISLIPKVTCAFLAWSDCLEKSSPDEKQMMMSGTSQGNRLICAKEFQVKWLLLTPKISMC